MLTQEIIVMKRLIAGLLMLLMLFSTAFALSACKKNNDGEMGLATEETVKESEGEKEEGSEEAEEEETVSADAGEVVTSFEPDAEGTIGNDLPMQIEKVELYKDGTVMLIPTDDLLKNELEDSKATSLMPFADSGDVKVKELYLFRIGNGGYRTIVALMDDGTVSAINPVSLLQDHIIAVKDRLASRDSFISVVQEEGEDSFSIVGKTEEGDDVILDPVILDEDGEVQPAE